MSMVPSPPAPGPDGGPIAPVSRWQERAASIPEAVAALSRIWSMAARQASDEDLGGSDRANAQGDPRLAGRLDAGGRDVRVRMRTSVLTLVVVAPRPETAERTLAVISALASRHPSRAIVLAPGDPDGPARVDAQISAACQLSQRGSSETCTEEILLKVGGELAVHLATCVAPLLIHDLPVVLWWPDDPPIGTRVFRDLVAVADRLLVDSGAFRDDGARRISALASVASGERPGIIDIGWMRLTLWRELLAGLFDHPVLTAELKSVRRLRIDIARPSQTLRVTKAACFAGWLAARLDWEIARPMERDEETGRMTGAFRQGRREIPVEFRPVRGADSGTVPAPGSLARVELEIARARTEIRARVTRQRDHLLATADWNGAQITRRAGTLEPFDETPYVAEALDRPTTDRHFELALGRATRLIGG